MIPAALGLGAVALLFWAAGAFARARVDTVKALGTWLAVLVGLCVVAGLVLTGRVAVAASLVVIAGPLAWSWWRQPRGGTTGFRARSPIRTPQFSRAEAYEILGLPEGASDADIQAAWIRLMRGVHPDGGGTDWLAARVNAARDTLLRH